MCVCVLNKAFSFPLASPASSSNERQRAMSLLVTVKTHVHSILSLATGTSGDLRQVTFFPHCPISPCAKWKCITCSSLVGLLTHCCSDEQEEEDDIHREEGKWQ